MKKTLISAVLLCALIAQCDNLITKSGKIFRNYSVIKINHDSIVIGHQKGKSNILHNDLPESLLDKYRTEILRAEEQFEMQESRQSPRYRKVTGRKRSYSRSNVPRGRTIRRQTQKDRYAEWNRDIAQKRNEPVGTVYRYEPKSSGSSYPSSSSSRRCRQCHGLGVIGGTSYLSNGVRLQGCTFTCPSCGGRGSSVENTLFQIR